MTTLLMRLQGMMQSWGTTSRFDERDTQLEPSKSGVIGLVCAALGRDRVEPVNDLAALRMGVRLDREGTVMRDYQTVGGERDRKKKTLLLATGEAAHRTVISPRFYLADAAFLVGLEGKDPALLASVHRALRTPVWPLFLGRKSFVPGMPVHMPGALLDRPLLPALQEWAPLTDSGSDEGGREVRYALEDPSEGSIRLDQPIAAFSERRFGPRFVKFLSGNLGDAHVPDPPGA